MKKTGYRSFDLETFDDLTEKRSARELKRGFVASFLFLLVVIFSFVALTLLAVNRVDKFSVEQSESNMAQLISSKQRALAGYAKEYGFWNEAIENVVFDYNADWTDTNVSGYLISQYLITEVLAYDLNGKLIFSQLGDESALSVIDYAADGFLDGLFDEALSTDVIDPKAVVDIVDVNGQAKIISVMAFVGYDEAPFDDKVHGTLVLVQDLDLALADAAGFDGLNYSSIGTTVDSNSIVAFALTNNDQKVVGYLTWMPVQLGKQLWEYMLPKLLPIVALLIYLSYFFYKKLVRYNALTESYIESLKLTTERLHFHAHYDELTGLVNRYYFIQRVNEELSFCQRSNRTSALLYMDLDGFKSINDTFGHENGDRVLKTVADRLGASVRQEDIVGRFGGDEFCILLRGVSKSESINAIVEKIHQLISEPFIVAEQERHIGVSIGIVRFPKDGNDVEQLFHYADLAMYSAKAMGSNSVQYHDIDSKSRG